MLISYLLLNGLWKLLIIAIVACAIWDWFFKKTETVSPFSGNEDRGHKVITKSYFVLIGLLVLTFAFMWFASQF